VCVSVLIHVYDIDCMYNGWLCTGRGGGEGGKGGGEGREEGENGYVESLRDGSALAASVRSSERA